MYKIYDTGILYIPVVEKLVKEMEKCIDFEGTSRSIYRILKDIIESLLI